MVDFINKYEFPQDVHRLCEEDLDVLAKDVREFLIDKVSQMGGHLGSNLGIVELTIALHKVFDVNKDKLVWDVGHQSYVHKILTGRADDFDSLRQLDGLSGFPKVKEFEGDVFDTGHASNSISVATGLAAGRDIQGEDYNVVAIIGDGSLTGGMAYEALNNGGELKSRMIVVLNDNGMSISPNVGGISRHLYNLRTSASYKNAKVAIKNTLKKIPRAGNTITDFIVVAKDKLKYAMIPNGILFEELGFDYIGPIDGHDLKEVTRALEVAKASNVPIVVHVMTQKGRGYGPAEKNPGAFHGVSPFDRATGEPLKKSSYSYSNAIGDFALALGKEDKDIVAISAAMCKATGLDAFRRRFPNRFFDVGIAEAHGVSFSAGLAKTELRPLVAIYSSFLQRGYDQIIEDVCLQSLPVVFAIDRAGVVGPDGETHHGVFDISYLRQMPNMKVFTPTSSYELAKSLAYAFAQKEGPVAIRYPKAACQKLSEEEMQRAFSEGRALIGEDIKIDDEALAIAFTSYVEPLGSTQGSSKGLWSKLSGKKESHVELWCCGKMSGCGKEAVKILEENGYSLIVRNFGIIKPLDVSLCHGTKVVVTLEDNLITGGFGQEVASRLAALKDKQVRVVNLGWPDEFIEHGTISELEERYGLDPKSVASKVLEIIER